MQVESVSGSSLRASRWLRTAKDWLPRGQSLSEDVWRVRHRMLSYLLRAHVAAVFIFALIRGYSLAEAVMYAGIIAVIATLASTDPRRRRFVSAMNALGLVTSSAVLVNLSGGLIEMHFHFFVMVGILTLYQDWMPFLLAIGFVVLHHGLLGVLAPRSVYNNTAAIHDPIGFAFIHGLFVLAASVASIVAWRMNEEQAFRDSLTHLPNRSLFQDRVSHALARADRRPGVLAVLFVDLDGFKDVNDSLGHAAGDQLLCQVAERLRACVRPADTAARIGGDEFAVLVEDLGAADDAAAVAARILDGLAVPFVISGRETTIGASIGIAMNDRADDVESLLRNADVAMYSVKESGRARFDFYSSSMLETVVSRVDVARQLRHAVERNELVLHYQPIVDLSTREVLGVEALLRWDHPTRGLLYPPDFIKIAEESGAIVPIGTWVLDNACRQASVWKAEHPQIPIKVTINLSPVQVFESTIVQGVRSALDASGLDADDLVLELTEEIFVKDTDLAAQRLNELKQLGVSLAIDDFGSGYSSLTYLARLPFDVIKIDKGFVDMVADESKDASIARAILSLGQGCGLYTVAEGIERQEQADALRLMGCSYAQGYLFARPMPADDVGRLLRSGGQVGPAATRAASW